MTGIERLRRMVDDDVIAVPCVKGTYDGGYVAAIHDMRREALSIADQIEREHAQTVEDHEKQQGIIRDLQRERDEALRAAAASRRVASELRTLAGEWDEYGLGGPLMSLADRLEAHEAAEAHSTEVAPKTYTREESDERNASCDDNNSEPDATFEGEKVTRDASIAITVLAVVEEMERHCLGVEWMQDSPVARWARELREVVGWPVRGEEDAKAAKWVREHGGLNLIKNRDKFATEALAWLRRLSSVPGGKRADVDEMMVELDNRLMPPGMEWPRYEDGEPVKPGSWLQDNDGEAFEAVSFVFTCDWLGIYGYHPDRYGTIGPKYRRQLDGMAYGTPAKRPAVPAADGEPLEVGQTVWHVSNGIEFTVVGLPKSGEYQAVKLRLDDGAFTGLDPDQLTHQRPVLDADGVPICGGECVWGINGGLYRVTDANCEEVYARHVRGPFGAEVESAGGEGLYLLRADRLTHTKPEIDSWERVEEDARGLDSGVDRELFTHTHEDIVRRCKALAKLERGEK